jgi:hypothetical protein
MSSLQQNWRKEQNRFLGAREVGEMEGTRGQRGDMAQIMYAHMNK